MNSREQTGTRGVARAAVRAGLAEVAHALFVRDGFDNVTIDDIALAAGVHRTTFLRYFNTKEDAVVGFWDTLIEIVLEALDARPIDEDDWTALRRAFAVTLEPVERDRPNTLIMTRLIHSTPSLWTKQLEKQSNWCPPLARCLAERQGSSEVTLGHLTQVAAALVCLNVAVGEWVTSNGERDLEEVVDDAFNALVLATRSSRLQRATSRREPRSSAAKAGTVKSLKVESQSKSSRARNGPRLSATPTPATSPRKPSKRTSKPLT